MADVTRDVLIEELAREECYFQETKEELDKLTGYLALIGQGIIPPALQGEGSPEAIRKRLARRLITLRADQSIVDRSILEKEIRVFAPLSKNIGDSPE